MIKKTSIETRNQKEGKSKITKMFGIKTAFEGSYKTPDNGVLDLIWTKNIQEKHQKRNKKQKRSKKRKRTNKSGGKKRHERQ